MRVQPRLPLFSGSTGSPPPSSSVFAWHTLLFKIRGRLNVRGGAKICLAQGSPFHGAPLTPTPCSLPLPTGAKICGFNSGLLSPSDSNFPWVHCPGYTPFHCSTKVRIQLLWVFSLVSSFLYLERGAPQFISPTIQLQGHWTSLDKQDFEVPFAAWWTIQSPTSPWTQ